MGSSINKDSFKISCLLSCTFLVSLANCLFVAFTIPLKRLSPFLKSPSLSALLASAAAAVLYFANFSLDSYVKNSFVFIILFLISII